MNIEDYRTLFIVTTLVLVLAAVSPLLSLVMTLGGESERFSELWLLGSNHLAEGYPVDVQTGEKYNVFVGVGNHMGEPEYYRLCVKLGNDGKFLPDINGGEPSSSLVLFEYRFFVDNGGVWEVPITFGLESIGVNDDVLSVGKVVVNNISVPADISTVLDDEKGGYFLALFFELWRYDLELDSFEFDNRVVGLWLNITAS